MIVPLVLMTLAGVALALGSGLVRPRAAEIAFGLGPAFMLGVGATATVAIALLTVGVALVPAFFAGVAAAAAAGALLGWRRPLAPVVLASPAPAATGPVTIAVLLVLAVVAVLGVLVAREHPFVLWDSWWRWGRKALALRDSSGLDASVFTNASFSAALPDYPLLLPFAQAVE